MKKHKTATLRSSFTIWAPGFRCQLVSVKNWPGDGCRVASDVSHMWDVLQPWKSTEFKNVVQSMDESLSHQNLSAPKKGSANCCGQGCCIAIYFESPYFPWMRQLLKRTKLPGASKRPHELVELRKTCELPIIMWVNTGPPI